MRRFTVAAVLACAALGCGKSERPDNSKIQSPADQPIGAPTVGGAKGAQGAPGGATLEAGGRGQKSLKSVEVKE